MRNPDQDECSLSGHFTAAQLLAHKNLPDTPAVVAKVMIRKVANGFIVTIGCKTLVAETWDEVSRGLKLYWDDPVGAEKQYCD